MRFAVFILLCPIWAANAQQPPPQPPKEVAPAQEKSRKTDPSAAADPLKMADPKHAGEKGPPQSVTADNPAYVLGAEDQIFVYVFQGQEFSGEHMIRPDGKITINLIGDVQAADLTSDALAKSIKEKVKTYVNDPDVTVRVLAVKSKKYLINGEVNKPGEYPLVIPTRVFQALVNAGGFKEFANQKKIVVIHEDNSRDYFNWKEVVAGKKLEQNIWLRPGDIIVVK